MKQEEVGYKRIAYSTLNIWIYKIIQNCLLFLL